VAHDAPHDPCPTRRRALRALLAATLACCALPGGASAATIGITADGTLAYRASDGEANVLSVRGLPGSIEVTDSALWPSAHRTKAVTARGRVSVVPGQTRLVRAGRDMTAQLALRVHRSLADRRLRLEVDAVDVRGLRQVLRRAGSLRVVR
jgi:hypothetical protein